MARVEIYNVNFREFQLKDLEHLMDLEKTAFPLDAYRKEDMIKRYRLPQRIFLIAEVKNKIVGYIVGIINNGGGQIDTMAVRSPWRRRGIGSQLVKRVLEFFDNGGVKTIGLEVRPTNEAAISLYKKFGFEKVGRIKNYYKVGSDAIWMRLNK